MPKGSTSPLTEEQVQEIIWSHESERVLAGRFGKHKTMISRIKNRRIYEHVPELPDGGDWRTARLPEMYERAKEALAACDRLDECKDWANKAEALASYARQAKDDELERCARQIRLRAMRRVGQLLKKYSAGRERGGRPRRNGIGTDTVSQRQAARAAGLSKRQEATARRLADVPKAEFDAKVESGRPPSATQMAERGKRVRPNGREPDARSALRHVVAALERIEAAAGKCPAPKDLAGVAVGHENLGERLRRAAGYLSKLAATVNRRGAQQEAREPVAAE
jgi:hypothetical protein